MNDESCANNANSFYVRDQQLFKIKLALSSLSNSVIVCPMIVNLYTMSSSDDDETWSHFKKGVPVLIMNRNLMDNTVSSLDICLADPHTGFALWKEALLPTSEYKATQKNFHTFRMASNDLLMVGMRFPISGLADVFLGDVLENLENLEIRKFPAIDIALGEPELRNEKRTDPISRKKISKTQISRPCMFTHVTSAIEVRKDENMRKGMKLAKMKQK